MRLKTLEIVGFKSFLEPITISFAPGVTAVVGPNGCGKSNIVDAIRWVLGEQAPTRLRGKATEDLIYAGNDKHPAAGMAEVSLVLEAQEHSPLPEPFASLSEVAVTRRVFRSGDSEYLLNKIPCRLKDITELFLAAQIHSRGYAIIEQGKIEEIIHAKPAELRALVEEAAGLALFKGRRELSERKLERVRENLSRLTDVVSEIERQLNFARRQAKKAETFKVLKQEADELERLAAARRLLEQEREHETEAVRANELQAVAEQTRHQLGELRQDYEQARVAEQTLAEQLNAAGRELESLRTAGVQRADTRRFIERRLTAAIELEPQLLQRIQDAESKVTTARAARAELGARLARESNAGGDGDDALGSLRAEYQAMAGELARQEAAAERMRDQLTECLREAAMVRGRAGDLTRERDRLQAGLEADNGLAEQTAARARTAAEALKGMQAEVEARRVAITEQEAAQGAANEAELEARAARDRAASGVKAAQDTLKAAVSRIERLKRSAAGERLRVVLESLNGDRPAQTPRFLQEVIRAPRDLEPALRAVLGEQLSSVIVETPGFALRAIDILKRKRSGRLSFVPRPSTPIHGEAIQAPGIRGRLVEMLAVQDGFEPVAEAILGNVLVADDLSSALAASNLNGHGTIFVTREGDVVWPASMISGGSSVDLEADSGADQMISVEEAQAAVTRCEALERDAAQHLTQCRARREQSNTELAARRRLLGEAERALAERRNDLARIEQQVALTQARHESARRRLAEIETALPEGERRLQQFAADEERMRQALELAKMQVVQSKAQADAVGERMRELASRIESRKAKLAGLAQELRQLNVRVEELEGQIERDRDNLRKAMAEKAEYEAELSRLRLQEEADRAREEALAAQVGELKEGVRELAQEVAARRGEVSAVQAHLTEVEGQIVECGLRRERAATLREELTRAFHERFEAEFDGLHDDLARALADRDTAADEVRLADLRTRLTRIGEVNLAAESEVKELEERATTLGAQRADMEKALHDLSQTVQKLNREARTRFAETFEAAARHFSEIFPKLLRGGNARLELIEAQDMLEAGVNILVQPAGKKVKDISLLSGGEKALSALALVFSLFLLNPSPFCLLDEVDAPLDEFSVAAFTGLIQELKERSQFIVITHNQRTMQRADQIHGVTMEQPGISRIISLKLPEAA
jgi:chromosome segregation protein